MACLLIIGHHLAFYGPMSDAARPGAPALVDWFYDYGRMAVQVFLVLGGYLAARGLAPAGAPRATDPMRLIGHRFARLALPYCAALALTILVNEAVREFGFRHESVSDAPTWDQILAHLLLVQSIGGWESLSAGVWYVAIDFQLFALCALWFWLSLRLGGTAQGSDRTSAEPALPTLAQLGVIALGCASLWWWNQAEQLDVWALYFVGAYALGMMAWWAAHSPNVLARCGWLAAMLACGAIALTLEWRDRIALAWAAALALAVCSAVHWPEAWRRGLVHPPRHHAPGHAEVDQQALARAVSHRWCRGRGCCAGGLLQRLLQPCQAHGLGQVVGHVELKGRHGMFGVGGDEDDGRRLRAHAAQGLGQLHAVHAGHVDVEQHASPPFFFIRFHTTVR